jgi:hypothetical protein
MSSDCRANETGQESTWTVKVKVFANKKSLRKVHVLSLGSPRVAAARVEELSRHSCRLTTDNLISPYHTFIYYSPQYHSSRQTSPIHHRTSALFSAPALDQSSHYEKPQGHINTHRHPPTEQTPQCPTHQRPTRPSPAAASSWSSSAKQP